jgi:hypothetical protein
MAVGALVLALLAAVAAGVAVWYAAAQAKATERAARASEAAAEASRRSADASERAAEASERFDVAGERNAVREPEREAVEAVDEAHKAAHGRGSAEGQGRLRLRSSTDGRGRRLIVENLSSAVVTDVACEVVAVVGDSKPLPRIGAFGAAELHLGESASSDPFDPTVAWPRILECRVRWSDGLGQHDERMDVNVLQG